MFCGIHNIEVSTVIMKTPHLEFIVFLNCCCCCCCTNLKIDLQEKQIKYNHLKRLNATPRGYQEISLGSIVNPLH